MTHTVTKQEINAHKVVTMIASSFGKGDNKRLNLRYDCGRKRLTFEVVTLSSTQVCATLEEAVAYYNEATQ